MLALIATEQTPHQSAAGSETNYDACDLRNRNRKHDEVPHHVSSLAMKIGGWRFTFQQRLLMAFG
jgi:hypothetical protein